MIIASIVSVDTVMRGKIKKKAKIILQDKILERAEFEIITSMKVCGITRIIVCCVIMFVVFICSINYSRLRRN
jgi:hypothetical protein